MKSQTQLIRETILRHLRNTQDFDGMIVAELDGSHFSAADIALPDSENHCQVYRLIIVRHETTATS